MPADRDPTYTPDRPACPCCGRRVGPLDREGMCAYCGPNRARGHVGEEPCNLGRPTYTPDPGHYDRDAALIFDAVTATLAARGRFATLSDRSAVTSAVLAALAAAGRLHLPGGKWEWAVRLNSLRGRSSILPRDDEEHARLFFVEPAGAENAEPVRRWVGPWLPEESGS